MAKRYAVVRQFHAYENRLNMHCLTISLNNSQFREHTWKRMYIDFSSSSIRSDIESLFIARRKPYARKQTNKHVCLQLLLPLPPVSSRYIGASQQKSSAESMSTDGCHTECVRHAFLRLWTKKPSNDGTYQPVTDFMSFTNKIREQPLKYINNYTDKGVIYQDSSWHKWKLRKNKNE